jgi:hypothetical protein
MLTSASILKGLQNKEPGRCRRLSPQGYITEWRDDARRVRLRGRFGGKAGKDQRISMIRSEDKDVFINDLHPERSSLSDWGAGNPRG